MTVQWNGRTRQILLHLLFFWHSVDGSEYELKCVALCGSDVRTTTIVIDTVTDEDDEQLQLNLISQLETVRIK